MKIPSQPISVEGDEIVFDLASDELNDDWINSSRLSKEERQKKEKKKMYYIIEGEEDNAVT